MASVATGDDKAHQITPVDVLRQVNEGKKAHSKLLELSRELYRGEWRKTKIRNKALKKMFTYFKIWAYCFLSQNKIQCTSDNDVPRILQLRRNKHS